MESQNRSHVSSCRNSCRSINVFQFQKYHKFSSMISSTSEIQVVTHKQCTLTNQSRFSKRQTTNENRKSNETIESTNGLFGRFFNDITSWFDDEQRYLSIISSKNYVEHADLFKITLIPETDRWKNTDQRIKSKEFSCKTILHVHIRDVIFPSYTHSTL